MEKKQKAKKTKEEKAAAKSKKEEEIKGLINYAKTFIKENFDIPMESSIFYNSMNYDLTFEQRRILYAMDQISFMRSEIRKMILFEGGTLPVFENDDDYSIDEIKAEDILDEVEKLIKEAKVLTECLEKRKEIKPKKKEVHSSNEGATLVQLIKEKRKKWAEHGFDDRAVKILEKHGLDEKYFRP